MIIYFSQPESYSAYQLVDGVSGASKLVKDGEMLGANEYLAKEIQKITGAELFRLETVQNYPTTHQPLLDFAQEEQRKNIKPALKSLPNLVGVDTVFLVYPIWLYQMPMPLYSLLEQVDFSGKNIVPVVGHGGSRLGGTDKDIQQLQPKANVKKGFEAYLHKSVRAEPEVEKRLATFLMENGGSTAVSAVANTAKQVGSTFQDKIPNQRKLGNLTVSALGLGCQGLGQNMYGVPQPTREQAVKLLHQAFDHGVTFFDTAEAYGPFESERVLGEGLKPFRDQVVIATKFGWDIDQQTGKRTGGLNSRPEHIKKVVDAMLQRLQTDRIDLLYQHRVDPTVPIEDVAGTIRELMKQGKVLNWGLSEASETTIRKAHKIQPLTAVQSEYSLFFRGREKDVIPVCEELGIGFVPWSPLAMGALAGYVDADSRFDADPTKDFRGIVPRFTPEAMQQNVKLIQLVQKWAKRKLCTPAQLSLGWLMAQKDFIVPIPGTTKARHLLDNLGADDVKFTVEELTQFRQELETIDISGLRLPEAVLNFSEAK